MKYQFKEIMGNKKKYLDLLLLADEQEDMIDRYLECGRMFVLDDNGVKCAAVVVILNQTECELKNLATYPAEQAKGYGHAMVDYLFTLFFKDYETIYVGTGNVPKILRFYKSCGFFPSHVEKNFFIDHYTEPIIEDGVQLVDMIYLRADAKTERNGKTPGHLFG